MSTIDRIMRSVPVIPVLVVQDVGEAREMAEALVDGGLNVLEVTLRTDAALPAIRRMNLVKNATVGAGTVVTREQLDEAIGMGAEFIVSPGLTEKVATAASKARLPYLPGVATAGDIMRGLDLGLDHFKFFPAMAAGGIPALKALAAPFYHCKFCPTGGITAATAPDWLALPSVLCVGGSWVVQPGASLEEINQLAREAAALAG
jgi:2-dehydro-3-deoxyphosphogluconate aldolase / (4S)-4-hydroxy-2-oxoglutarate aldolase